MYSNLSHDSYNKYELARSRNCNDGHCPLSLALLYHYTELIGCYNGDRFALCGVGTNGLHIGPPPQKNYKHFNTESSFLSICVYELKLVFYTDGTAIFCRHDSDTLNGQQGFEQCNNPRPSKPLSFSLWIYLKDVVYSTEPEHFNDTDMKFKGLAQPSRQQLLWPLVGAFLIPSTVTRSWWWSV